MCFQNAGNVISEPLVLKISYEPPPPPPSKTKLKLYTHDCTARKIAPCDRALKFLRDHRTFNVKNSHKASGNRRFFLRFKVQFFYFYSMQKSGLAMKVFGDWSRCREYRTTKNSLVHILQRDNHCQNCSKGRRCINRL